MVSHYTEMKPRLLTTIYKVSPRWSASSSFSIFALIYSIPDLPVFFLPLGLRASVPVLFCSHTPQISAWRSVCLLSSSSQPLWQCLGEAPPPSLFPQGLTYSSSKPLLVSEINVLVYMFTIYPDPLEHKFCEFKGGVLHYYSSIPTAQTSAWHSGC